MILISGEALIDLIPDPEKAAAYDAVLRRLALQCRDRARAARRADRVCFAHLERRQRRSARLGACRERRRSRASSLRDERPTPLAFVMRGTAKPVRAIPSISTRPRSTAPGLFRPTGRRARSHLHVGSISAVDPRHGESVVAALRAGARARDDELRPEYPPAGHAGSQMRRCAGRAAGLARERRQGERRGSAMALSRPRDRGQLGALGAARAALLRRDARRARRRSPISAAERLSVAAPRSKSSTPSAPATASCRRCFRRWTATARSAPRAPPPDARPSRELARASPPRPRRSPARARARTRRRSPKSRPHQSQCEIGIGPLATNSRIATAPATGLKVSAATANRTDRMASTELRRARSVRARCRRISSSTSFT